MIGMAGTMPDFVHGLNLFYAGDYPVDKPGDKMAGAGCRMNDDPRRPLRLL
jgi:hypothetical protein